MKSFYRISDNTLLTRGFPWVRKILNRPEATDCPACGRAIRRWSGTVRALLDPTKGAKWPDALGCGPLHTVSERTLEACAAQGIGPFPSFPLELVRPFPKKLSDSEAPKYFWLDGTRMRDGCLDFEKSGFVDVRFCPECGVRSDNISATHRRQRSRVWPYVIRPGTWKGSDLFTTDLSDAAFFCTEKLVECARKYRLINSRFTPVEAGIAIGDKGVRYLD